MFFPHIDVKVFVFAHNVLSFEFRPKICLQKLQLCLLLKVQAACEPWLLCVFVNTGNSFFFRREALECEPYVVYVFVLAFHIYSLHFEHFM